MAFEPRKWQQECHKRFLQRCRDGGKRDFVFEACPGAGKSAMAAWIAKTLLDEFDVDHVLALVPWKSIQGDIDKGMLGTFGTMGLDARSEFFTLRRRQAHQPIPDNDATVTLYQEVCNQQAIETLKLWQERRGMRFALICDEIHHTNEINSSWGTYVEEMKRLAEYSIFMSGTYFRGDRKPIGCIDLESDGRPIKHYEYTYQRGVREAVVRSVTVRYVNANVTFYDKRHDQEYEIPLDQISTKELSEAKKQILDPSGECMRKMIEDAHLALTRTRQKFPDAACLFVCRPGTSDDYTSDTQKSQSIEDKHVHIVANQIKDLTGDEPTVVTYRDKDAVGKIARFRRGTSPYLVAVNMVSEGCDIPRLRAVAFCRYTTSEMLFRQVVGRALRVQAQEDGTAAQVYLPKFPLLVEYAERLWTQAQEGVKDRRCKKCNGWPCECPCSTCGQPRPCECERKASEPPDIFGLDHMPIFDGGHMGSDDVNEEYIQAATQITQQLIEHLGANVVQLGHALQHFDRSRSSQRSSLVVDNPVADRDRIRRRVNRMVRRLAVDRFNKDFAKAWHSLVEQRFGQPWSVIIAAWSIDRLRDVEDYVERRYRENL